MNSIRRIDFPLFFLVVGIMLFGLLIIYDASSVIAFRDFHDKYYYLKEQSQWAILGFSALVFFSFFNYKHLYNFSIPLLITAIVLLFAVFIPGLGIKALGAKRWINFGFFVLQPAEFVKLSLAIYLAAWFSNKERGRFMAFAMLMSLVLLLVMAQPDMGTASIILSEAIMVYFLSGANMMQFFALFPAIGLIGFIAIKLAPYRAARLQALMNLGSSLEGASYHVKQILIALGSGGILGVGIGNSLQKYEYLPENVTDSIFAIIAEEFGLLGGTVLIVLYFLLVWRGFRIAARAKDPFGRLLAGALIAFLGVQIIINLAAMTALIPLTGVPLPFISYGGSALVVDMASIGILLNISKHTSET